MKKYQSSLVLGKMCITHLGHLYLIETAAKYSEQVHVVVCHNESHVVSGELRIKALQEYYKCFENITFHLLYDGHLPQSDSESESLDAFYALWCPEVYKIVPFLDCVFTSEDYGTDFARYLKVDHFLVDKERVKFPISGTMVRSDVYKYYDFILPTLRYVFNKKVVFMGAESVGKSTMTKRLAEHFNTNYVEEYGRTFCEQKPDLEETDFVSIAEIQEKMCDEKIHYSNKFLFVDTEAIITSVFHKLYYPVYDEFIEQTISKHILTQNFDLYIVLGTNNVDCVQDGTRRFLNQRNKHTELIISELKKYNKNYIVIDNMAYEERFKSVVNLCDNLLK